MLANLTPPQKALARCMSDISERAFAASWMDGLELFLWSAMAGGATRYGKVDLTQQELERLRVLSEGCGGWIAFEAEQEEVFVPLEDWIGKIADTHGKG